MSYFIDNNANGANRRAGGTHLLGTPATRNHRASTLSSRAPRIITAVAAVLAIVGSTLISTSIEASQPAYGAGSFAGNTAATSLPPKAQTSPIQAFTWHALSSPSAPGEVVILLAGTCPSPVECIALGGSSNSISFTSNSLFSAVWHGSTWTGTSVPTPYPGDNNDINSISCISATECFATGYAFANTSSGQGPAYAFILGWNGISWSDMPIPIPPGNAGYKLFSVSCTPTAQCIAVGDTVNGATGNDQTLALGWTGSSWSQMSVPDPGGSSYSTKLTVISCPAANTCIAAGEEGDVNTGAQAPVAIRWTGSSWSLMGMPDPGGSSVDISLTGLDCVSGAECLAVGGTTSVSSSSLVGDNVAFRWDGFAWFEVSVPDPGQGLNTLASVSCISPSECFTTGESATISSSTSATVNFTDGYVLQWNGTGFTNENIQGSSAGMRIPLAVTCSSQLACFVFGGTVMSGETMQPLAMEGEPPPDIVSLSPSSGLVGGGAKVTITGTDLAGTTEVHFGPNPATNVNVVSPTEISATVPVSSAPGVVDVSVTNQYGTSPAVCADQFEYGTSPSSGLPGSYIPISPTRIADTRPQSGYQGAGQPLGCDSTLSIKIDGVGGLPSSGITAVTLNVTAAQETANSFITVYPAGSVRPSASNLSIHPDTTVANLVTVPVGAGGQVSFYNSSGTTDLIVDAEGYYTSSTTSGGGYVPLAPQRLVDTRCTSVTPKPGYCARENIPSANASLGAVPPKGSLSFNAGGADGVPLTATAVELNVTEAAAQSGGYLTVYPAGSSPPTASNVNFTSGETVANRSVVETGSSGQVTVFNSSSSPINVVIDLGGYYAPAGSSAGYTLTPSSPARVLDTRCAASPEPNYCVLENLPSPNAHTGPLSPPSSTTIQISGDGSIPLTGVAAVVLNVTTVAPSAAGYLSVYPGGEARPTISDLNWPAGKTVANLAVVEVGANGTINLYSSAKGSTNVIVDVLGWYS